MDQVCQATNRVENDPEQLMAKPGFQQYKWIIQDIVEKLKHYFISMAGDNQTGVAMASALAVLILVLTFSCNYYLGCCFLVIYAVIAAALYF